MGDNIRLFYHLGGVVGIYAIRDIYPGGKYRAFDRTYPLQSHNVAYDVGVRGFGSATLGDRGVADCGFAPLQECCDKSR